MRVHVVDPSSYTPPYDHALCRALSMAGADVELYTSSFAYGRVVPADGYVRHELFYRAALGAPGGRLRRTSKLIEHVPNMLGYRHAARTADVVHFQWLAVQAVDGMLLPTGRPLVLTAHDVLPREPRPGQLAAQRRLYERFDAIVVHSEHGRGRLTGELGVDPERVHVIPHGAFVHLTEPVAAAQLSAPPFQTEGPVVLFFGLIRPYKGIDVLLEAWRGLLGEGDRLAGDIGVDQRVDRLAGDIGVDQRMGRLAGDIGVDQRMGRLAGGVGGDEHTASPIRDAELWIVGMPKLDITALRAAAPPNVRFVPRFVSDDELAAYFERADLVVLPYLQADQSGVLFTALAFGKPLLLSDVGGFPEMARTGAARIVPAGDSRALGRALRELLADRAALTEMCVKARAATEGRYSWESVAQAHLELYERLLRERPRR